MGYYPQESLYKPYKYHGYTSFGKIGAMEISGVIFGSAEWRIENPMYVLITVGRNPANHLLYINPMKYGIFSISTGAGFLPSTVMLTISMYVYLNLPQGA